ncbi:MAG: hypothetical protein H6747_05750 [Deltaproteobacteria bacterium]|nr:hypothetical protein [Deltaproteobacteria bacterium]
MSCRSDYVNYPEWDPKAWRHSGTLIKFKDGICRDRGRLTVIATPCDLDPETGRCRFGKDDIEVVVEWQGGEDLVAPEDEWIDAPDRHLSVKICQ